MQRFKGTVVGLHSGRNNVGDTLWHRRTVGIFRLTLLFTDRPIIIFYDFCTSSLGDRVREFVKVQQWWVALLAKLVIPYNSIIMIGFHEIYKDRVRECLRTEEWPEAFLAELDIPISSINDWISWDFQGCPQRPSFVHKLHAEWRVAFLTDLNITFNSIMIGFHGIFKVVLTWRACEERRVTGGIFSRIRNSQSLGRRLTQQSEQCNIITQWPHTFSKRQSCFWWNCAWSEFALRIA